MSKKGVVAVTVVVLLALALPANAQWLNYPTPNIPRTPGGKPNLTAPAARGTDGHPDLSGVWTTGPAVVIPVPDEALTATSKALIHERQENYFKDRPAYRCQPDGPATCPSTSHRMMPPSIERSSTWASSTTSTDRSICCLRRAVIPCRSDSTDESVDMNLSIDAGQTMTYRATMKKLN